MGSRLGGGINPGRLFDRVTVEAEGFTTSNGRRTSTGWATVGTLTDQPADVQALEGMERIRAMQTQADVTHEVTMRHVDGVMASHRLKVTSDGDRILYVVSPPIIVGRKRWMTLLCREEADT